MIRRIALAVLIPVSFACSAAKTQTNAFATLAEAREAGAVASGWVPDGIPPHAHDLREAHIPGTGNRWGLFEFPPSEQGILRELLQTEEISLAGQRCEISPRIEWWPVALRGDLDGASLAATGLHAYRSRSGDLIFAVNWRQGRAYYWAPNTNP
jgi:hypothetical protein